MSVRVVSLASGSSGNAVLIDAGQTRLLIDAGISARRLAQGMARLGVAAETLDGLLVTHEHVDHVAGLPVLSHRLGLTCYLTRGTARAVAGIGPLSHQVIRPGTSFDIGRATITPIPVRHDAIEPCGYVVEVAGATIAVFTDLGCPEPHLLDPLRRADLIVLEANHDLNRLFAGAYPWPLKQRVASDRGHLCNDDCGLLLANAIEDERPRAVWLAHLSEENNDPTTALASVRPQVAGRLLDLAVLPRHTAGPVWEWPARPPSAASLAG